ncbi:C-x8-C-x5-C-x3-H type zinc finger protein-like protein [Hyaloscypha variabilis F]|uniref:C-x8-C-x5-C-x3-H type zinc finger protein-like protein n=1 Tax=Hyaloscypha variabilis (strain UAMH 11265 / GT02V1 / F) TaxID=1149755 RepID=A0A2J6S579_HYAVF|nr:C-x8-C-x5-C-x3-H type zinc finger protein-like protein [Hyaloscypha variabilis F]
MAIMDFVQRFQALQLQRDTGNELIKDLLIYCEGMETGLRLENARLAKELEDAQLDLDDARRSRRDLQQQLNLAQQRVGQFSVDCDSMRNRNPYIMVLIDGDGMIFNEDLIHQGIEGGKQAANALRNSVLEHCSELTDEIEIMAKVCANITGLSKAMRRDGSLDNPDDLRDFTLGFTQGKASFDFIDVGHGKERADSKIKECMRWHLRNHNCKQILLGISHDAGYAPFLDEVVTQDDRCRITIIEGPPTVRELVNTGLQILNFNNIFRADKLVDRLVSSPTPPSTWAGVTSIAPPPPAPISIPPAPAKANGTAKKTPVPPIAKPAWVPSPRGLDPPITVNATVLDKIKRRTTNNKLCNNHYLRGPCAKGDECCFEHQYKATDEDLKAIAYLTRLNPCLNGQDCELEFCIYGHHCPSVTMGAAGKDPVCNAFGCRFAKEDHPPNTVIKHPRKERWEKEYERY